MFDIKKFLVENKTMLNEASSHPLIKRLKVAVRNSASAYAAAQELARPEDRAESRKAEAQLRRVYTELEQALSGNK